MIQKNLNLMSRKKTGSSATYIDSPETIDRISFFIKINLRKKTRQIIIRDGIFTWKTEKITVQAFRNTIRYMAIKGVCHLK